MAFHSLPISLANKQFYLLQIYIIEFESFSIENLLAFQL